MERGRDGERGQAANEYAALLALVAVVFLGLVGITAGGLGSHVLAGIQRAICTVAPGPCPRPVVPRADLAACPLERRVREERLSETIAVVKLGTSGTLTAVRSSDGRVTVTLADGSSVGATVGVGLTLFGIGAEGRANAGVAWASGRAWTFPDATAAQRFVGRYGRKATIGGKLLDDVRGACSLLCDALGWRPHPQLPPPDEVHEEGGALASLSVPFGLGGRESSAGGEAAAVLGRKRTRAGETTWYVRLSAAASARLRLPGSALAGSGGGRVVLSYRLDHDGTPLTLGVHAAGEASGSGSFALDVRDGRRGRGADGAGRGGVVELDATLDLTDPANRAAAGGLLDALRGDVTAVPERARALAERIERHGQLDRRRYALSSDTTQLGASVSLGVSIGGAFERTTKGLRLLAAETRLPGLPFLPRDDCRV